MTKKLFSAVGLALALFLVAPAMAWAQSGDDKAAAGDEAKKDGNEEESPEVKVERGAGGKKVYAEYLERIFIASPSLAGERLYLLSEDGEMLFLQAGREYKLLGTAHLGEKAFASPAFADGRIYIRGEKNLYAIGK